MKARLVGSVRRSREFEQELKSLAGEVQGAQARERERIACLLHDEVGSQIVNIQLELAQWRAAGRPQGTADDIASMVTQLGQTLRRLTFGLAPPSWHAGLLSGLEAVACEFGRHSGLNIHVTAESDEIDLPELQRGIACRVVRELCLNVQKHARARHVEIASLLEGGWLCVRVQDDGDGIETQALPRRRAGLGLTSARAQLRAVGGELQLGRGPGRGTCARVLLPVAATSTGSTRRC